MSYTLMKYCIRTNSVDITTTQSTFVGLRRNNFIPSLIIVFHQKDERSIFFHRNKLQSFLHTTLDGIRQDNRTRNEFIIYLRILTTWEFFSKT